MVWQIKAGHYTARVALALLLTISVWAAAVIGGRRSPAVNSRVTVGIGVVVLSVMAVVAVATAEGASDRQLYMQQWRILETSPTPRVQGVLDDADLLFNSFLWVLARVAPVSEVILYGVVAAAVVGAYVLASRLLLPGWATLGALFTVLALGLVASYSGVAIRQGLAVAVLLVAVALYVTGRASPLRLAALAVVAGLFHWSALPIGLAVAVMRVRTPGVRVLLGVWLVLAVAYLQGWNQLLLDRLGLYGAAVQSYSSDVAFDAYLGGQGGRVDFLLASAAMVVVALVGRRMMPADPQHARLTAAFLVFNCAFLLAGFVAFSDRIAAYSWFLAPWLLWLPMTRVKDAAVPVLTLVGVLTFGLTTGTLTALAS